MTVRELVKGLGVWGDGNTYIFLEGLDIFTGWFDVRFPDYDWIDTYGSYTVESYIKDDGVLKIKVTR